MKVRHTRNNLGDNRTGHVWTVNDNQGTVCLCIENEGCFNYRLYAQGIPHHDGSTDSIEEVEQLIYRQLLKEGRW